MNEKQEREKINTQTFTCPNCGGTMIFDIKKQNFVCQACGGESPLETEQTEIKEYDFSEYKNRESQSQILEGIAVSICSTCGAEVLFDEKDTATVCPMCGSSQVSESRQRSGIPPEGLIPFQIDKQDAQLKFKHWIKTRWFAPNKLKHTYGEGNLTGLYIPFWTYDADTYAFYTGRGGRHYTETDKDGKTVVKTRWYRVSGSVARFFDDIQICASRNSESEMIDNVLPYNTINNTHPFSIEYLSGFKAERYTIKADEGFNKAKSQIQSELHSMAHSDILMQGYDVADSISLNVSYKDIKYKHVLLPIWSAIFGYNGKTYRYIVNGETGRVSGERPYSIIKITLAVVAAIIAIISFIYLTDDNNEAAKAYQEVHQVAMQETLSYQYLEQTYVVVDVENIG